jgi:hypothetical protein
VKKNGKRADFFYKVALTIIECREEYIILMPFEFYRNQERQLELFEEKKSKATRSKHQDWLAMDFVLLKEGEPNWKNCEEYQRFGEIAEKNGLRWLGKMEGLEDIYHIEYIEGEEVKKDGG